MKSPVLFIIFKRVDTTRRVFERIREAKPPRLYVAADGPRKDRFDEIEKCIATRKVVENIDWPCEVFRLFREENLGCGKGVSSAITWFFEHEEQGIIIEDDVLPHIDFFRYCDEMLDRYRDNQNIQLIAGRNYFLKDYPSKYSYYLSSYAHIWGWASWRRVWKTYCFDVNSYDEKTLKSNCYKRLPKKSAKYFCNIYEKMKRMEIDTWDYQLVINEFFYNRYAISPFVNMIENLGMGSIDAVHTKYDIPEISSYMAKSPYPLRHPEKLTTDEKADLIAMKISWQYVPNLIDRIQYKIISLAKRALKEIWD